MLPKLTVVTPSYNQAAFLEETIRSVIAQREEVHEYFVLDGGSTDGSADIVRRHADQIDYWESAPDGGQARAIDKGFRRATGDIVYWLNSDDVILPGAFRAARETFALHPSARVVLGWNLRIDSESRILWTSRTPRQTERQAKWGMLHIAQQACFFRRDFYLEVGGLRPDLACVLDTELWFRMLKREPRWTPLRRLVGAFRLHADAKGARSLKRYAEEHAMLRETYPEYECSGIKRAMGSCAYRAYETLRGRYLADLMLTRALRGRRLSDLTERELRLLTAKPPL